MLLEEAIDKLAADEGEIDFVQLSALTERLLFQRIRVVGEYNRSGSWATDNFFSAASAVKAKLRCSRGKAHKLVRAHRNTQHHRRPHQADHQHHAPADMINA